METFCSVLKETQVVMYAQYTDENWKHNWGSWIYFLIVTMHTRVKIWWNLLNDVLRAVQYGASQRNYKIKNYQRLK